MEMYRVGDVSCVFFGGDEFFFLSPLLRSQSGCCGPSPGLEPTAARTWGSRDIISVLNLALIIITHILSLSLSPSRLHNVCLHYSRTLLFGLGIASAGIKHTFLPPPLCARSTKRKISKNLTGTWCKDTVQPRGEGLRSW